MYMDQVMVMKRTAITLHSLEGLFLSFLWKFAVYLQILANETEQIVYI